MLSGRIKVVFKEMSECYRVLKTTSLQYAWIVIDKVQKGFHRPSGITG